jgi:phosphohistidine phosphatase
MDRDARRPEGRILKTLHLLRHAKSSWADATSSDHQRDLNDRGRRDAPRMGAALAARCPVQPVYCSTALRARRTLEGLCQGWPALAAAPQEFTDALYTFDYRDLLAWLRSHDGAAERCFIIAHNPGLTDLCNQLLGRPALDNLPTAGYLELSLPVSDWADVSEGSGELLGWLFPRDLPRE